MRCLNLRKVLQNHSISDILIIDKFYPLHKVFLLFITYTSSSDNPVPLPVKIVANLIPL